MDEGTKSGEQRGRELVEVIDEALVAQRAADHAMQRLRGVLVDVLEHGPRLALIDFDLLQQIAELGARAEGVGALTRLVLCASVSVGRGVWTTPAEVTRAQQAMHAGCNRANDPHPEVQAAVDASLGRAREAARRPT